MERTCYQQGFFSPRDAFEDATNQASDAPIPQGESDQVDGKPLFTLDDGWVRTPLIATHGETVSNIDLFALSTVQRR